jgi:hypothetical protein
MSVFKKKKNTVGYKYYLGMHMVLCHSTLDSLNAIYVDGDKTLWVGRQTGSGTIEINKPDILGGDKSEGGISGELDVIWGSPTETPNQYLGDNIGAIPNFRGVASVVLKQMYLGNNSYLKPWSFKATRTRTFDNWYPQKGAIGGEGVPDSISAGGKIVLIFDSSYSMSPMAGVMHDFSMRIFNYIQDWVDNGAEFELATYCVSDFIGKTDQAYIILDGSWVTMPVSATGYQNPRMHVVDWESPPSWYTFKFLQNQNYRFPRAEYEYMPDQDEWVWTEGFTRENYTAFGNSKPDEPIYGLGAEAWGSKSSTRYYTYSTDFSEVDARYNRNGPTGPGTLDTTVSRKSFASHTYNVESFMVSPSVLTTFLDLSKAENKVVIVFSDYLAPGDTSNTTHKSMYRPLQWVEDEFYSVLDTNNLKYTTVPESDTFYSAIVDSAKYFRKIDTLRENPIVSYNTRNLIKCMNIVVTKETEQEIFPWVPPKHAHLYSPRSVAASEQFMGTMPSNYFDSVPVLDSADGANADVLFENFKKLLRWEYDTPDPYGSIMDGTYNADMGPAHIIRECLTNPIWGMGYPADDIDDFSFKRAADIFFDEKLGLSLLLEKETTVEDFIKEVLRHVDAVLYIDRRTGLFCLKPVRDDYNVEGLPVLDESNVLSMSDYSKPTLGELTNSITVNAWDKKTNTTLSVTVQNAALSMVQGREIGTKIQYPGITNRENALRLAQRDLRTYSTALVRCTLEVNDNAKDLTIGGVFAFSWKDYEIDKLPMRIVGLDYGTDRKHAIRITCVQDVFATPLDAIVRPVNPQWENPTQVPPSMISDAVSIEAPYYELCAQFGQPQVDINLDANPELGCALIAAMQPPNSTSGYAYWKDSYAENHEVGNFSFTPYAFNNTRTIEIDDSDIIVTMSDEDALKLRDNTWLLIDREILALNLWFNPYKVGQSEWYFPVKRGCFDTQPAVHLQGAPIFWMEKNNILDDETLVKGERKGYLLASINPMGQTPLNHDFQTSVVMNERAIRPYPPQGVRINGHYFNERILTQMQLMWYHRNRKLQTGGEIVGFDEFAFTSPEPGVTYTVKLINNENNEVLYLAEGLEGPDFEIPQESIPFELDNVNLRISTVRDGFECLYPYEQRIFLAAPVGGNLEFELRTTHTPPAGDNIELIFD